MNKEKQKQKNQPKYAILSNFTCYVTTYSKQYNHMNNMQIKIKKVSYK